MPYMIVKDETSGKFNVYKRGENGKPTGRRLGSHPSKRAAADQIAAISANEDKTAKGWAFLTQAEAGYIPVSSNMPEACSNCRWFNSWEDYQPCRIVQSDNPYPIVSNGWCERWEAYPALDEHYNPTGETLDPGAAVQFPEHEGERAVHPPKKKPMMDDMGDMEDMETEEKPDNPKRKPKKAMPALLSYTPPSIQRIAETFWDIADKFDSPVLRTIYHTLFPVAPLSTSGFKMLDDKQWLAWWTNNFVDREAEIITHYAIEQFVKSANSGDVPMPELWWMHIPGTKHGVATRLFHLDHFALATGVFDDEKSNPLVSNFKSWYSTRKSITVSHGFRYPMEAKIDNAYYKIQTYEISTLIAGREANRHTNFQYPVGVAQ